MVPLLILIYTAVVLWLLVNMVHEARRIWPMLFEDLVSALIIFTGYLARLVIQASEQRTKRMMDNAAGR
jgi:hypothetical protein